MLTFSPTRDLELAIEVPKFPLRSGARCWEEKEGRKENLWQKMATNIQRVLKIVQIDTSANSSILGLLNPNFDLNAWVGVCPRPDQHCPIWNHDQRILRWKTSLHWKGKHHCFNLIHVRFMKCYYYLRQSKKLVIPSTWEGVMEDFDRGKSCGKAFGSCGWTTPLQFVLLQCARFRLQLGLKLWVSKCTCLTVNSVPVVSIELFWRALSKTVSEDR